MEEDELRRAVSVVFVLLVVGIGLGGQSRSKPDLEKLPFVPRQAICKDREAAAGGQLGLEQG